MRNTIPSALGAALLITLGSSLSTAAPQVPYPNSPDWTSSDTEVSTGAGFGDINGDGWDDLIVANGNDIYRQRLAVYHNNGNGTFPSTPSWSSSDIDYHGHLSVGDVNSDGWPDIAVSVYLGPAGFSQEGYAKLYLNNGSGTLSSTPSWTSNDTFYSFSCALGDADGDGDLDLAVATGENYYNNPDRNRIYFITGGMLAGTPGWQGATNDYSYDVDWGDMDGDGDLDLVFCNAGKGPTIHYSNGSSISTSAGWQASTPSNPDGNTLSIGDINHDGYQDIAYADNNQLSGTGRFYAYYSNGSGGIHTTPDWTSQFIGYTSAIVLCDVQGDGWLDAITGEWWGEVRMYLNTNGTLSSTPGYISSTNSVVEALPLSDVDKEGLVPVIGETHAGDGSRKIFYSDHAPIMTVASVLVDGLPLPPSQYCYEAETGWFSLATAPTTEVILTYTTTTSVDFAVSNWDSSKGNYLFRRQGPLGTAYCFGDGTGTACPCGNESPVGDGLGCENSLGHGAMIVAGGSRSTTADDLFIVASGLLPSQSGLLFSGPIQVNGGAGILFGAGLRCAGGPVIRHGVKTPDLAGTATWGGGLSVLGGWGAGDTVNFQVWYRDPSGACNEHSNQTNGLEVVFLP